MSWGSGGLWLHVCPGGGGVWKKKCPPEDNFWNSPDRWSLHGWTVAIVCVPAFLLHLPVCFSRFKMLLSHTGRHEHITEALAHLHWLPNTYHVQYKNLLLVFMSLHGLSLQYLQDLLHCHNARSGLHSAGQMLDVPHTQTAIYRDCTFCVLNQDYGTLFHLSWSLWHH